MGSRSMWVGIAVAVAMLGFTARASAAFDVSPSGCHARPEAYDPDDQGNDPVVVALFGYDNPNAAAVEIDYGPDNLVLQPPNARSGQPQEFQAGVDQPVWDAFYDPASVPELDWILDGAEATSDAICGGASGTGPEPLTLPTLGSGPSTAAVGDVLAVGDGSFAGPTALTYAVVERCDGDGCVPVTTLGDMPTSYTVAAADTGWSLRVRSVALTMDGWASAISAPVTIPGTPESGSQPTPPTTDPSADQPEPLSQPTVDSTAGVGLPVTADLGTWAGSPTPTLGVQWQRCGETTCDDIPGADTTTYTPVSADLGDVLRAVVTATADGVTDTFGGGSEVSEVAASPPTAPVTPAPAVRSAPQITGAADIGSQLTLTDPGSFDGPVTTAVRWQACDSGTCQDLPGATGTDYVLTAADAGSMVRAQVTATSTDGQTVVDSGELGPAGAVRTGAAPQVIGVPAAGTLMWTDGGSWVADPAPSLTFQWLRCDGAGDGCAAIPGATGPGYDPAAADVGHTLRVTITATNGFSGASAMSSPSAVVAAAPARTGAAPSDDQRPALSGVRASPRRFQVGRWVGTLRAATTDTRRPVTARTGTVISLRLSEPAWLRLDVDRFSHGRLRTVATLTRTLGAGTDRLRFSGRLPRALGGALRPGRYRLMLRAFNAAGRESRRQVVRVTVLRSRTTHAADLLARRDAERRRSA